MKRLATVMVSLFMIAAVMGAWNMPSVRAAQLHYFSFNSQTWYVLTPNDTWNQTWNDNFTLQKTYLFQSAEPIYWAFAYVQVKHVAAEGNNTYCERRVMIKIYAGDNFITFKTIQAVFHDGTMNFSIPFKLGAPTKSLKIEVWSSTGDGATINYTVKKIAVLAVNDQGYSVNTQNIDYKAPSGVAGKGLALNRTVLDLGQVSLAEGAIRFWFKWDGKPVTILSTTTAGSPPVVTPALGVNANGSIIVYDNGTRDVLSAKLPKETWVIIAFSWKAGKAYIMTASNTNADNATIANFTWNGNFQFNAIGGYNQSTGSVIDEFYIWNNYLSPSSILATGSSGLLKLKTASGNIITVEPEGGAYLPTPITISYYNSNNTLINYNIWYGANSTFNVPNGTTQMILSSNGVARRFLLSTVGKTIAFPAKGSNVVLEKITIVPPVSGELQLVNTLGQVVTSENVQGSAVFAGIAGNMYYISFSHDNTTRAFWFTLTGEPITMILSTNLLARNSTYASATFNSTTNSLKIEFYSPKTTNLTISITFYKQGLKLGNSTIKETTSKYIAVVPVPNQTDFAQIVVKAGSYEKKIGVVIGGTSSGSTITTSTIFPSWLLMGIFAVLGLLIAPARYKYLSPLIASAILTFSRLIGIFNAPTWLISSFVGLALLSLIIYRPASRGGEY